MPWRHGEARDPIGREEYWSWLLRFLSVTVSRKWEIERAKGRPWLARRRATVWVVDSKSAEPSRMGIEERVEKSGGWSIAAVPW
jgi:hypothetical protein